MYCSMAFSLPDPSGLKPEDLKSADKVLAALEKEARPDDSIRQALETVRRRVQYRMTPAGEGDARYQIEENFHHQMNVDTLERHTGWLSGEMEKFVRTPNSFIEVEKLLQAFIPEHRGLKRQMPAVGKDTYEWTAQDGSWVVRLNCKTMEMDMEQKTVV